MPDRVLRQFGILQHILEAPVDMTDLRVERSRLERTEFMHTLSQYHDLWYDFMDGQIDIVREGSYMSMDKYMNWYRRVTKPRIAPFTCGDPRKIVPRDCYSQQNMVDAVCF